MFGYEKEKYVRLMRSYRKNWWREIKDEDAAAPESGMYLLSCLGDMHLVLEAYRYEKGELFNKFFTGRHDHYNSPFKYMRVPDFEGFDDYWLDVDDFEVAPFWGNYVVAYRHGKTGEVLIDVKTVDPRCGFKEQLRDDNGELFLDCSCFEDESEIPELGSKLHDYHYRADLVPVAFSMMGRSGDFDSGIGFHKFWDCLY